LLAARFFDRSFKLRLFLSEACQLLFVRHIHCSKPLRVSLQNQRHFGYMPCCIACTVRAS
jgi:hypothetical protein